MNYLLSNKEFLVQTYGAIFVERVFIRSLDDAVQPKTLDEIKQYQQSSTPTNPGILLIPNTGPTGGSLEFRIDEARPNLLMLSYLRKR